MARTARKYSRRARLQLNRIVPGACTGSCLPPVQVADLSQRVPASVRACDSRREAERPAADQL